MMKTNKYGYVRYGWSIKYHETRRLILSSRHTKIWSLFYLTYLALTENSFKKKVTREEGRNDNSNGIEYIYTNIYVYTSELHRYINAIWLTWIFSDYCSSITFCFFCLIIYLFFVIWKYIILVYKHEFRTKILQKWSVNIYFILCILISITIQ